MTLDRNVLAAVIALLVPLLLAMIILWLSQARAPSPGEPAPLDEIEFASSAELREFMAALDYSWPPHALPRIAVQRLPVDLDQLGIAERKEIFLLALAPLIMQENQRLAFNRRYLIELFDTLNSGQLAKIPYHAEQMRKRYSVAGSLQSLSAQQELLMRVDTLPLGLVLAQAANETGWGTSRFAQEANNLFGMWTYNATEGMTPEKRADDAQHYVRKFGNLSESVQNFMYTINSGEAYEELRRLRANGARSPTELASGLARYSSKGEEYVAAIKDMIRQNQLESFDQLPFY